MGSKLAVVLSATALVVSLLGSTSAGRAALDAVVPVRLAKRAYLADTAKNALKVDNIKASRTPTPGMLLALDAAGKLPASVGAVGPKGDKGDPGATNVVVRVSDPVTATDGNVYATTTVQCASGEVAVGGGGGAVASGAGGVTLTDSKPTPNTTGSTPTGWSAGMIVSSGYSGAAYVICARP
jgi:hypothetical protein